MLEEGRAMLRRSILAIPASLLAIALATGPVAAAKPDRSFTGSPEGCITFAAGELCDFGIQIDFLVDREYLTTFFDKDGNVARDNFTGSLRVRITNLDDPTRSIELDVGGPGGDRYAADGTATDSFHGHGLPLWPATDNHPAVYVATRGNFVYLVDADFNLLGTVKSAGRSADICAMLAS
jgi:hypothetical protein